MKTNWKQTVNEINRKRYTIPEGWETREQVAECLQCDPAKVADILKAGIASGEVERQTFQSWDENRRMAVGVVCYRIAGETEASEKPSDITTKIRASIKRNPGYSNSKIANNFKGVSAADVAQVRSSKP